MSSFTPNDILDFWFEEIDPSFWFMKDELFDQRLRARFHKAHEETVAGVTALWRNSPEGRLAEVIVLDQFSRNMFRNSPQAFASDPLALHLAQEAVRVGDDQKLPTVQKSFLYMPYMHSESREIHEKAVTLFSQPGLEDSLKYELQHKAIIDRFGRYPHRNKVLGRTSTPEEIEFLKQPGSSF
ncbi:DUF924 family protein [Bdellovibrio sp. 22V]|uniref:DUF924 family protein n=1 Tax=Bdellovibrio TaxID=958 RepID=UPI002542E6A2|nr:DUF924 family protein [Bdellovibrio sp. 22V]WII72593.1 DUF924 family protein [Bdellovibrio sp. 22V]